MKPPQSYNHTMLSCAESQSKFNTVRANIYWSKRAALTLRSQICSVFHLNNAAMSSVHSLHCSPGKKKRKRQLLREVFTSDPVLQCGKKTQWCPKVFVAIKIKLGFLFCYNMKFPVPLLMQLFSHFTSWAHDRLPVGIFTSAAELGLVSSSHTC